MTTSLFAFGTYVIFIGLPDSVAKLPARLQIAATALETNPLSNDAFGGTSLFESMWATTMSH